MLSDGVNNVPYTFGSTVIANQPPTFAAALTNRNLVRGGGPYTYSLPAVNDPEGSPTTVIATYNGATLMPFFMTFSANVFSMDP